jgi:hypothetical protein
MYNPGRVPLDPSQLPSYLQTELGKVAGEIDAYNTKLIVPVWNGASGDPVLGNGSLSMRYKLTKDLCELWLQLVIGSTTTFGSGEWRFQLPVPAKDVPQIGCAHLVDVTGVRYSATCEAFNLGSFLRVYTHGVLTSVRSTSPFTWATDDKLYAHIRYLRTLDT